MSVNKILIQGQIYLLKNCQNCGNEISNYNPKLTVLIDEKLFHSFCKEECLIQFDKVFTQMGKKIEILEKLPFQSIYAPLIKEILNKKYE